MERIKKKLIEYLIKNGEDINKKINWMENKIIKLYNHK